MVQELEFKFEKNQSEESSAALVRLLMQIGVVSNEATSVETPLKFALDRVCEFTTWPVGHVYWLANDGSGDLVSLPIWHFDEPSRYEAFREITERTRFSSGIGLPGRVLASGKPAWIIDVQVDPNFPRAKTALDIGVHAGFGFPVRIASETVGVLEFFASVTHDPDESLLEVMDVVGVQLGRVAERMRALELQNRLVGTVSHDLRTPLAAIMMQAQLLERGPIRPEAIAGVAARMLSIGARMDAIIRDLLDYADARALRGFQITREKADIGSICQATIAELGAAYPQRQIAYDGEGNLSGDWDTRRLRQMLDNLVANAIKYSIEESIVVVRATGEGEQVRIRVSNAGTPIDPNLVGRIFEPFRRGDSVRPKEGVGLGLFIVQAIVRAHGGSIGVTSETEQGTTFTVDLPRSALP